VPWVHHQFCITTIRKRGHTPEICKMTAMSQLYSRKWLINANVWRKTRGGAQIKKDMSHECLSVVRTWILTFMAPNVLGNPTKQIGCNCCRGYVGNDESLKWWTTFCDLTKCLRTSCCH
jgi:hypothetical protein